MDGKTEAPDDEGNLQDEDFFSQLTEEERECLQYLLETIDSLDQDLEENINIHEQDTVEHLRSPRDGLRGLSDSVKVSDKAEYNPSPSKMKIIKSFSEDCPGLSITVTPDLGPRSAGSHPSHLRKFDTIMRSGVNVQELRARFIRQQASSTEEDPSKGPDINSASKQLPQAPHTQMSARQEALQKLGFITSNPSSSSAAQHSPEDLNGMDQHTSEKNSETNQSHSKTGNNLPHSPDRKPGILEKKWPP